MRFPSSLSAASLSILCSIFATTALAQGSVRMINYCPDYVLFQTKFGPGNTTQPETLLSGDTYSTPFLDVEPEDSTARQVLSFDVWPAYNSDKKARSVQRKSLAPRDFVLPPEEDFGFIFLIWDVIVTKEGVAYNFEDQATDPFPEWGWTWKLSSGDTACAACTTLDCSAKGCSPQEDIVMEFCGEDNTPEPLNFKSAFESPALTSVPTSLPAAIGSSTSTSTGTATPLDLTATRSYPQSTASTTSAPMSTATISAHLGQSGRVLPSSNGGNSYQPSPTPSVFTGAASTLRQGYLGAIALAAALMML